MNFIETIFESFQIGLNQIEGKYPNEIKNFIIGSGSHFIIHKSITNDMALNLYKEYKNKLPLGTKISKKEVGNFIIEDWHTLESNTGHTYTFMFEVDEIIEHNPNDVITEWIQNDKKHKGFMEDLLKLFIEEEKKHEKSKNTNNTKN